MVHFVGAGPGACDLITVRGMNRIKEADVIIYAGSLVNPELLSYAKADCKIYNSAHMTLDAVVDVMREAEAAGKGTVRLHTGDPSVYGAIREQMDLLDEYGIAYDVCPGVSAVFGAAASPALGSIYEKSKLYDAAFATEYRGATEIALPAGIRRVLLITCSVRGYATMQKLAKKLENISGAEIIAKVKCEALPEVSMKETVKACVDEYFEQVDAIVFVTASGIAVRSVAEHLTHKSKDPAIVYMDECSKHVISLVSGHAGGANALTQMLADVMWATPVITTATDVEGQFSIDDYAREHNLVVTDWAKAKAISAEVLATGAKPVWVDEAEVSQEEEKNACGNRIDVRRLKIGSYQVIVTPRDILPDEKMLQLVPLCIVAGIGCKKGTSSDKIEHAVQDAFAKAGLRMEALCAVASIDLKKEEAGLLEFCETRKVPFEAYTAEELQAVSGTFSASEFVTGVTGVDNVCERSAVKYASEHGMNQGERLLGRQAKHGELLLRKQAYGGVTVALAYVCSE